MKKYLWLFLFMMLTTTSFAAMNALKTVKEVPTGNQIIGLIPATHVDNMVLAADTPEVYTIPTGAVNVLINCTGDVWIKFGGAAAVPTTEVTDGTASELNPALRNIVGFTTIGFSSAVANKCSICVWNK